MNVQRIPISSRDQWLSLRSKYIGASDAPAVCGEGMFGSAARVYAEKKGLVPGKEMTDAMRRGLWGEAAVFEALAWERPQWEQRRAKVYLLDADARLGCTPDGAAVDPARPGLGVVQAKVISKKIFGKYWLENPDDDPHDEHAPAEAPLGYQLQTLTEGMLANADWMVIAALVTDEWKWSLRLFDVPRNAAAEAAIRARVAHFWERHLDPGIEPPVDPARDEELVRLLYPTDTGATLDLTADNRMPALVDNREQITATIKQLKEDKETIDTEIKAKLGSNSYGLLADGRTISWKLQHRSAFHMPETDFRVLRVLRAKGKHLRRGAA